MLLYPIRQFGRRVCARRDDMTMYKRAASQCLLHITGTKNSHFQAVLLSRKTLASRLIFIDGRGDERHYAGTGAAVLNRPEQFAVRPHCMELTVDEISGRGSEQHPCRPSPLPLCS